MQTANGSINSQQPNTSSQQNSNQQIRYNLNTSYYRQQQQQQQTQWQQQSSSPQSHTYTPSAQRPSYQQTPQQPQQPHNAYAPQQQYSYNNGGTPLSMQSNHQENNNVTENNGGHTTPPVEYEQPNDGSGYALAALISGIIAFIIGITVLGGFLFGIAALILAHKRSKQYKLYYGVNEPIDVPMTVPSKAKERIARVLGIIGIVEAVAVLVFSSLFADTILTTNVENTASNLGGDSAYVAGSSDTTEIVDSTDVIPSTVEGTIENPAAIGEWLETVIYFSDDDTYETIYYRITSVDTNDETVQASVDAYNTADSSYYTIDAISGDYSDELHYVTITYEIYVPTSTSAGDGFLTPDLSLILLGVDGGALEANGYTYQGLSGTDITVDAPAYIYPGETYMGTYVFISPTAATNALIQSVGEDTEGNTVTANTLVNLATVSTSSEIEGIQ